MIFQMKVFKALSVLSILNRIRKFNSLYNTIRLKLVKHNSRKTDFAMYVNVNRLTMKIINSHSEVAFLKQLQMEMTIEII